MYAAPNGVVVDQVDAATVKEHLAIAGFDDAATVTEDITPLVVKPFVKHLDACIALGGGYWRLPTRIRLFVILMKMHQAMPAEYVVVSARKPDAV